jgi:hypothetical protein
MAKKTAKTGKGKKRCPKCGTAVGNATRVCKCGHEFYTPLGRTTVKVSDADVKQAAKFIKQVGGTQKACAAIMEAYRLLREGE